MGYDTTYSGEFTTNRALTREEEMLFEWMQDHTDWQSNWDTDFELLPFRIFENDVLKEVPHYVFRINEEDSRAYHWRNEIEFLLENFFKPNNIILNGSMSWNWEEIWDTGTCIIVNNELTIFDDKPTVELLDALKKHLDEEYQEHLGYAKDRNWSACWFESVEDYMEDIACFSDDENTLWERGYRYGVQAAIDLIKNLSKE